jgi:hypothetical protein
MPHLPKIMAAMRQSHLFVQSIVSFLHVSVCITLGSMLNPATETVSDSEILKAHMGCFVDQFFNRGTFFHTAIGHSVI